MPQSAPVQSVAVQSAAVSRSNALATACAIWSGQIIIAVVLLSRRLTGEFTSPTNGSIACAAATVAMLFAASAFLISGRFRNGVAADGLAVFATLVPPFVIALPLLPVGATVASWYLVGLFALSGIALLLSSVADGEVTTQLHATQLKADQRNAAPERSITPIESNESSPLEAADLEVDTALEARLLQTDEMLNEELLNAEPMSLALPEVQAHRVESDRNVSQWMTRGLSPDGCEFIEGGLTIRFSGGQTHAVAHLPIQPALATIPEVECKILDGADVRLKIAARQAYGIRIEARRSGEATEEATAEIGFTVSEVAPTRNVA
jgi:hypothetical protein